MSKKTLNIEGIKNELEGASLYFSRPSTPPPPKPEPIVQPIPPQPVEENKQLAMEKSKDEIPNTIAKEKKTIIEPSSGRTIERTNERTDYRSDDHRIYPSKKRTKVRHAFDIFSDQLLSLREIALDQEKMFGERVLLGDLAQQALDMLIAKEKNK